MPRHSDMKELDFIKVLEELEAFATSELRNTSLLMSNPPQSSAAWNIRNAISKARTKLESAHAPAL